MNPAIHIPFDNRYVRVAERLFQRQLPTPVKQPGLIRINDALAEQLTIDPSSLHSAGGLAVLAGNLIPEGAEPIATAYAGHQFGSWNPQLGDGRAILLGEVVGKDGCRYDIQLKGAGVTPFSRMGDGRSPLGPVLREYIVSEAMAALGVPTTRSLAAVSSGERVVRETILPGAILTRVARSHIRVGTFQYFAARHDLESLRGLADHVIARHFPQAQTADNPYLELLSQVIAGQSALIAHWQSIGFVHGVMNTDNMLVSGETVDYGPCAFMESYHPSTVFSSIDRNGRYAYGNQPAIGQWNLAWLAQSLLPLIDDDEAAAITLVQQALDGFTEHYLKSYQQRMCAKLGLEQVDDAGVELMLDWLSLLAQQKVDFTLGFRVLADYLQSDQPGADSVAALYPLPVELHPWLQHWRESLGIGQIDDRVNDGSIEERATAIRRRLLAVNPVFIPRNHQVEAVIEAATAGDLQPFHRLVDLLATPFEFNPALAEYAMPARPEQQVLQTFCGT